MSLSFMIQCIAGVIQMINKLEFDGEIGVFVDEDVEVLETFAKYSMLFSFSKVCWGETTRFRFAWRAETRKDSEGNASQHEVRK